MNSVAAYAMTFARAGEIVTLRTYAGTGPSQAATDQTVRACFLSAAPNELAGQTHDGMQQVLILAAEVTTPPATGSEILAHGRTYAVEFVDDTTRRDGATLLAYVLKVRG